MGAFWFVKESLGFKIIKTISYSFCGQVSQHPNITVTVARKEFLNVLKIVKLLLILNF